MKCGGKDKTVAIPGEKVVCIVDQRYLEIKQSFQTEKQQKSLTELKNKL